MGCEVRTSLRCPEPSGLLPAVWEDLDGRYAATQKSSHIHGPDTMTSGGNATVVVCNADGLPPGRDPGQAQLGSVSDCQRSFCLNAISSPGLLLSLSNDFYVPPRGTIAMALAAPQGGGRQSLHKLGTTSHSPAARCLSTPIDTPKLLCNCKATSEYLWGWTGNGLRGCARWCLTCGAIAVPPPAAPPMPLQLFPLGARRNHLKETATILEN